jgi:hexosaminidase
LPGLRAYFVPLVYPEPMRSLSCLAGFSLVVAAFTANAQTLHLIPIPREVQTPPASALQPIPQGIRISCTSCFTDHDDEFTARDLTESLSARGIPADGNYTVVLARVPALAGVPPEGQAEGYAVTPSTNTLTLTASTAAGLFYAAQTLKQMIEGDGKIAVLHVATIRDWPAMQYRGVHDDLARGPIPTLEFQKQFVRTLAAYKINLYSPYFEHTQQYASNPLFAPPGGSISATDARALVAYATQYHVTVVPEQEAFGHLHHNLTWEQYQPLAETPHGDVLSPGQAGSLTLIDQMFNELAALYPGPFLHIGADETQNLGLGQSKPDVDTRGLGPVYLDFMQQIVTSLAPLHRRILFWGDIAQTIVQGGSPYGVPGPDRTDPQILLKLPAAFKQATIAVAWEYNPEPKGFAKFLAPFTAAGFETWVSPGVNNWSRVWPDDNDALPNIQGFIAEGQRQHSTGALNTIWYDDGEALANNNWYGLLFGAAASWQPGTSSIEAFQQTFGQVFHGDQTGALNQAQMELMQCHAILRSAKVGDGSDGLFWIDPWSKDGQPRAAQIRPVLHDLRVHAELALTLIAQARASYPPTNLLSSRSVAEGSASGTTPVFDPANALPSNPTSLHNPDAIDAMELGARRLDFLGLKFQLADEILDDYNKALIAEASTDKKLHGTVGADLNDIVSFVGRIRDIRDTYGMLRDLYRQAWLRSNRPYALTPVLARYDDAMALWQSRTEKFRSAQRQYGETKVLPSPADLGLPPH